MKKKCRLSIFSLIIGLVAFLGSVGHGHAESAFDYYIREAGGRIPNDLEQILAVFDLVNEGVKPTPERIASRALRNKKASESLKNGKKSDPRAQIAFEPGRIWMTESRSLSAGQRRMVLRVETPKGNVVIGFAPKEGNLEIISDDTESRLPVFQAIAGVGGSKPPIKQEINPNLCLTCHQNGGLIFSHFPWSDAEQVSDEAVSFDGFVRRYNRNLQKLQACRVMCGEDRDCRKSLLKSALAFPPQLREAGIRPKYFQRLQETLQKRWPEYGYAYPSSVLPDFFPNAKPGQPRGQTVQGPHSLGESPAYNDQFPAIVKLSLGGGLLGGKAQNDHRLVRIPKNQEKILDPAHPRPLTQRIPSEQAAAWADEIAFDCLGFDESDRKVLSRFKPEQIEKAIESSSLGKLVDRWPQPKARWMEGILTALGEARSGIPACYRSADSIMPLKPTAGSILVESRPVIRRALSQDYPARATFEKFCNECHGKDSFKPLPFDDLEALKKYKAQPSIVDRLRVRRMPPPGKPQPSAIEMELMIQALESGRRGQKS